MKWCILSQYGPSPAITLNWCSYPLQCKTPSPIKGLLHKASHPINTQLLTWNLKWMKTLQFPSKRNRAVKIPLMLKASLNIIVSDEHTVQDTSSKNDYLQTSSCHFITFVLIFRIIHFTDYFINLTSVYLYQRFPTSRISRTSASPIICERDALLIISCSSEPSDPALNRLWCWFDRSFIKQTCSSS